ncbi:hypothetical protein F511_41624 [Dorcoceras hygrometricum]|uniref:Uncharacterized protein n=1 Tax=Dorcoceras hygrometricum TaxID=472368 RepID=A0A2Z7B425_9LAMI|nr:hypothetical protein F511_41624 [Dorcoceras hygrometricum]
MYDFPSVLNSVGLLVQADEGVLIPVVDLIRRSTAAYNSRARFPCESGWSQAPRRQQGFPGYSAGRGGESAGDIPKG